MNAGDSDMIVSRVHAHCGATRTIFGRQGETFKAKEQLGRAIDIYKECGADGWVTRAEVEMAKIS
jgi:hypothetical protein